MASYRTWILRITEFLLSKYPFLNALSLLMLLGERNESYPPIEPRLIYISVGLLFTCGVMMSMKMMQKEAALVCAGQFCYFSYTFYTNKDLHYGEWHRMQIASRQFGCLAVYFLFSNFTQKPQHRTRTMERIGEVLLGLYLFAYAYILNSSSLHKQAFLSHILGGDWSRYFFTLTLVACALSFFAGIFVRDVSVVVPFVLGVLLLAVDCDVSYWTARGVHFWVQIRIILDTLCVMTGFAMFSQYFKNILGDYKED